MGFGLLPGTRLEHGKDLGDLAAEGGCLTLLLKPFEVGKFGGFLGARL